MDIGILINALIPFLDASGDYISRSIIDPETFAYRNERTGATGTLGIRGGKPYADGDLFAGVDVQALVAAYEQKLANAAGEEAEAKARLDEQNAATAAAERKSTSRYAQRKATPEVK